MSVEVLLVTRVVKSPGSPELGCTPGFGVGIDLGPFHTWDPRFREINIHPGDQAIYISNGSFGRVTQLIRDGEVVFSELVGT